MYLYDASVIIDLIKKGKISAFHKGATLDLAVYEVLNAIWKECYLFKKIKPEALHQLVDVLSGVFNVLDIYTVRGLEREVLNLALDERITVYDASYVLIAIKKSLVLATDDKKLADIASKYVKTTTSAEIAT
ncbi:MAG: type II toxin-antitoxin system VapC family toxin [Desulfurococcaceae archaeon]